MLEKMIQEMKIEIDFLRVKNNKLKDSNLVLKAAIVALREKIQTLKIEKRIDICK